MPLLEPAAAFASRIFTRLTVLGSSQTKTETVVVDLAMSVDDVPGNREPDTLIADLADLDDLRRRGRLSNEIFADRKAALLVQGIRPDRVVLNESTRRRFGLLHPE